MCLKETPSQRLKIDCPKGFQTVTGADGNRMELKIEPSHISLTEAGMWMDKKKKEKERRTEEMLGATTQDHTPFTPT
jgi:hypothetical protein